LRPGLFIMSLFGLDPPEVSLPSRALREEVEEMMQKLKGMSRKR